MDWSLSNFLTELSNIDACLPNVRHLAAVHSQLELSLTVLFWLGVCSVWRHFLHYMLSGMVHRLAIKEYGDYPMPSFVELPRDKSKIEKLNSVSKMNIFKKLVAQKPTSTTTTTTTNANATTNASNDKLPSDTTSQSQPLSRPSAKSSQKQQSQSHSQDLQKFIATYQGKSVKTFPMQELCKETGWSEEQIRSYWKYYYTTLEKKELEHKYLEELWKCLTVGFNALVGCYVMWHQPSFWNSKLLWTKFPQEETWDATLFYCVGVGYHLHRAVFQFFDHQRKDFVAMVLHHWTTVGLIWLSWHYGLTECGTIVMFCHDATDCFLAAAKLSGYHHRKFWKELFFLLFVLHWIFVRMGLFAVKVVITSTIDTVPTHSCHWAWYFFIPGLWLLLMLHMYWLTFIAGVIYRKVWLQKSIVDNRSDSDTWDES